MNREDEEGKEGEKTCLLELVGRSGCWRVDLALLLSDTVLLASQPARPAHACIQLDILSLSCETEKMGVCVREYMERVLNSIQMMMTGVEDMVLLTIRTLMELDCRVPSSALVHI